MCLLGENGLHLEAVKWYYDVVARHGPDVPESVIRHVRRCVVCRRQIHRLKEAITETRGEADSSRSEMNRNVIDTLNLHFRCLDERVTCSRVKPFLPGLLAPSLHIRIPTPITVHVDHCPECAGDLEAIQGLALGARQLEKLERLYEQKPDDHSRLCRRARSAIPAFVRCSFDDIDGEVLDHLCTCERCRSRVYRCRQKLLNELDDVAATGCCESISTGRLFDYAVPYDRVTTSAERAAESHMRICRSCLEEIQVVHETIYGIAERTDSGVATVYSTIEDAKEIFDAIADPYPEYPIDVQVIRSEPTQGVASFWSPVQLKTALNRSSCNPRVRFILKTAIAAAAMIPLAIIFLNTTAASGVTLAQVYKAFGRAQNVHISTFDPSTGQLAREFWISRRMDLVLTTRGQERILCDLGAKKKHVYLTAGASAEIAALSEDEHANWRRFMDTALGFSLSDIPADGQWTRMVDNVAAGVEAYELTYAQRELSGATYFRKWMISIDPLTRLPEEVQVFRRASAESEWHYMESRGFQYLTEDEMMPVMGAKTHPQQ